MAVAVAVRLLLAGRTVVLRSLQVAVGVVQQVGEGDSLPSHLVRAVVGHGVWAAGVTAQHTSAAARSHTLVRGR